jgi:hypothetical protein
VPFSRRNQVSTNIFDVKLNALVVNSYRPVHNFRYDVYIVLFSSSDACSIKVVHEQSGKVEYERERLLGIANKLMNFQSDSQHPFALVFDFSALLVDNLN